MEKSVIPAVRRLASFSRMGIGVCLLLAGTILMPRTASASCGDYLAHHNPLALHRIMSGKASESSTPEPIRPCDGPSCRRNDAPLPAPTPAPVRLIGERWANVLEETLDLSENASFFVLIAEDFCTDAPSARLDRPPRAA